MLTPLFLYVKLFFLMCIKNSHLKKIYIILYIFFLVIFIKFFFLSNISTYAKNYIIKDIEITEPYNVEFKKENVIDKAFTEAFNLLLIKILSSNELNKLNDINLISIKPMIDSFSIIDEKFVNNNYSAKFDVLFGKKEVLEFLSNKNIISSSPVSKNILFIPIFLDLDENKFLMYNNNDFYTNWNSRESKSELLKYMLPDEDIDDLNLIKRNLENIENYDFKDLLLKYDQDDFIISIFFKNKKKLSVLSKLKFKNNISTIKNEYVEESSENIIRELKLSFENIWKQKNQINTSIRFFLNISINSKNINLIERFENELMNSDLVYNFNIDKITNVETIYKITYNSTPDKFISEFLSKNFKLDTSNNTWIINE